MSAVPVLQALAWGGASPLRRSGEVDMAALAHGLARTAVTGGRRPQPYTRAQHAVVVSEGVEALAKLDGPGRRRLAMHAWLAEVRNTELKDSEATGKGKQHAALRTMDIEALADVLARTSLRDGATGGGRGGAPAGHLPPAGLVAPGAAAFEECLESLGGLDARDRRRLSLYGLLAETVLAGLGTAVAEAALTTAGLSHEAPEAWIDALRMAHRMADAAVRRDLPGAGPDGDLAFPAVGTRIVALERGEAAKRWLSRYRALTASGPGEQT